MSSWQAGLGKSQLVNWKQQLSPTCKKCHKNSVTLLSRTTREQHIFCYFIIRVGVQNNHKGWDKRGQFDPHPPIYISPTLLSVLTIFLKHTRNWCKILQVATLATKIVCTNFETSIENLGIGILNFWGNVIVQNNCSWYL